MKICWWHNLLILSNHTAQDTKKSCIVKGWNKHSEWLLAAEDVSKCFSWKRTYCNAYHRRCPSLICLLTDSLHTIKILRKYISISMSAWLFFNCMFMIYEIQWNLYNDTWEVSLKTCKFHYLPGTIFTKSCLHVYSPCPERPPALRDQKI